MTRSNTISRVLHDVGGAAWFGGALAGAVAVNGAAATVKDPAERTQVAVNGWARWAPVSAAAIGAHLLGGLGIILDNRGRIQSQNGVKATTVIKTVLTVGAAGTTAYSGLLGAKLAAHSADAAPTAGATEPSNDTPQNIAAIQKQLRVLQWITPVLTGALVGLGSFMGEQQRPARLLRDTAVKAKNVAFNAIRS